MSSEPQKLHPAAIGVLALGALRDAALPIIVLLFTAVAGNGLDSRRAGARRGLPRARRRGGLARGLHALAEHELRGRRARRALAERDRAQEADHGAARPHPGPRHRGRARSSGCSAWWRCTCRPRAAAPRARWCSTRVGAEAVERLREAVRGRRPEVVEDARAGDLPERRLSRRDGLLAALTAGQLGVILPVLAAAFQLFTNVFQDERGVEEASRLAPDTLGGWELAVGGLILAAWAISVAGSLVDVRGLHGHARRRAAADPARAAAAHRGGAAGAARARRARGRGRAAAAVRARDAAGRGRRLRRGGRRRAHALPAPAAGRGRAVPGRAAAGAGRRPGRARAAARRARRAATCCRGRWPAWWSAEARAALRSVRRGRCWSRRCSRSTAGSTTARRAGGCATAGWRCARGGSRGRRC